MAVLVRAELEPTRDEPADYALAFDTFDAMYRRWHSDLVAMCRSVLGSYGDPEDAAQEAFLRAWMARDRYSPTRPFWPWLSTIARRVCIDRRRRAARERTQVITVPDEEALLDAGPEDTWALVEDTRAVLTAIGRLRPHERRVLLLREFRGWSYEEIAVFEGATVESIRGLLKRARASVRRSGAEARTLDH